MKSEFQGQLRQQAEHQYQFSLKTLLLLAVLVAVPLGIWEFRKARIKQHASAARPFEDLGGVVASHPNSFIRFVRLYLFHSGHHQITSISFMNEPLTDQQLESIHGELHALPNLNRILLGKTRITDRGLSIVADLNQLSWIRLDDTAVTDRGVAMLQEMTSMEELGLARTNVTDDGLQHLSEMAQLRTLLLSDTQITDDGLVHLKGKPLLRMVTLRGTSITDNGLPVIAGLKSLETLDLGNTGVSDAGLMQLVNRRNLKNLALDGSLVTQDGIRQIRAALPHCQVSCDFDQ